MTPRMFDFLLKRKQAADRQEYYRAGLIASAVINFSMCHPEERVTAEMFVPGIKEEDTKFDLTKMSPEAQAKYVRKQFGKKVFRRK